MRAAILEAGQWATAYRAHAFRLVALGALDRDLLVALAAHPDSGGALGIVALALVFVAAKELADLRSHLSSLLESGTLSFSVCRASQPFSVMIYRLASVPPLPSRLA